MAHAIELTGLHFGYGRTALFSNVNIAVPQNAVFGLLGPNGAGKTTLMKLITGLLAPTSGTVAVLGNTWPENRHAILRRTGALIGQAALYSNLTARDNLRINARWFGITDAGIDRMLDRTGLSTTGRKQAKHFSTGMKQRLGIALALLHDPDLLLLDEPLNGLDPVMRNEVRIIIEEARSAGKTILISSHELAEIEKMCTHVAALNHGHCLFQGPIHDLLAQQARRVHIRCNRPDVPAHTVLAAGFDLHTDGTVTLPDDRQFARLIRQLVEAGVDIFGVETKMSGLDHFFKNTQP